MDLGLKGKVAVVFGGTTGIGAAAALRFAEEGCQVAVCSHNPDKVEAFKVRAAQAGYPDVVAEQVNGTVYAELEEFADRVVKKFGRIDIWLNCAGGNKHGPLHTLPEETFREIIDLNLTSCFFGIKVAAKYMVPQKSGSIVSISSLASKQPVDYRVTYGAAKAGVNLLTIGAAAELAPYGIRVNAIAPGVIDTALMTKAIHEQADYINSLIPMHRAGEPEEVGDVMVCIASDRFSYMTGTLVSVDGGKGTVEDAALVWNKPWE
ncbi:SDR family NAD(P)-dependent oxidoreductase [Fusibacillus kribbianus]|uniref:SDR family oxidoreductase n=1 Tax=Fusibacillus kribbianus TaxID=3044208 RepID=A0AAP4EZK0_9FIRM|nr:SDR family oxidoreductase [Ruminococcus sp. YH-rum2234]MDI9241960.1 SDR family oxidoreductase [Ruminococcus sp. YH-rum2234]